VRLGIAVIALFFPIATVLVASQEVPVWFWFATCGGPSMALEVRFDKKTIQKVTVPLCRALRSSSSSQGQAGRIEFAFLPGREGVQGHGRPITSRAVAGGQRLASRSRS